VFTLDGKLTFINIDQNYLKKLHEACSEVYYKDNGYESKPYIGILVNNNGKKYVIPLSSAKEKHKTWKNVNNECYLIYEMAEKSCMGQADIWVAEEGDKVKHILSVMDIKKMIPIIEGTYSRVNINPDNNDTDEVKKYKDLLNKEYVFCLKIINEVIGKANKLYDKQMVTGKIARFCCDFKVLESVAATMQNENVGK
jgi:protein AbiQ